MATTFLIIGSLLAVGGFLFAYQCRNIYREIGFQLCLIREELQSVRDSQRVTEKLIMIMKEDLSDALYQEELWIDAEELKPADGQIVSIKVENNSVIKKAIFDEAVDLFYCRATCPDTPDKVAYYEVKEWRKTSFDGKKS